MSTATAAPGTQILPGYTVIDLLGHGRRVDTYDVYSELRQCRCVIKIIRPDRAHVIRVREAVIREGMLLCELTHPHLLRGYELIRDPLPAMVLETLPGATLAALLEDAVLTAADTAELGLQLASALHYLHQHQWLHLDVKPANIVAHAGRATLIDLSLAAPPGPGHPGAGTDGYLAPEQITGSDLTPMTDVFSLGITLIESLTGNGPVGSNARPARFRHVDPLRRAIRALAGLPDLDRPMRHTLLGCLDPQPARRPTLPEIQGELSTFLVERQSQHPNDTPVTEGAGDSRRPGLVRLAPQRTRWYRHLLGTGHAPPPVAPALDAPAGNRHSAGPRRR